MDRVQAQCIEVIIFEPIQSALDEEVSHFITLRAVEIQSGSPGGPVKTGEIRPVLTEVISLRTQMVVDHIQRDR